MSNSKLTEYQKTERKHMLSRLAKNGGEIATVGRVTVAMQPEFPGSKMARMALSIASDDESKLRRKVGEYYALNRLEYSESVPLPVILSAEELATEFDERINSYF